MWIWLQVFFLGPPRCLPWRKSGGGLFSDPERRRAVAKVLREKYNELGPFSYAEKNVIALFVVLIALWLFRSPGFMTGWGDALKTGGATGEIGNMYFDVVIKFDILCCRWFGHCKGSNTGHICSDSSVHCAG